MKILFQASEFKPTKKIERYAHKKVLTLDKFHDRIIEAHVRLRKIRTSRPDDKACELKVAIPGNDPYVAKRGFTFEEAINKAVETMKRRIDDRKAKPVKKRQSTGKVLQRVVEEVETLS
ncbi:MAG TPA: HPF/RaiA family ribosome-associated protein [Cyclobacteriaceae bacterium]|jgi:putative sigma-54 modulation protein|nr:HPF/RaiA family ribosome-associated protein [Cyclobacteriaceae bacterium]